jgi:type III secretory pathway component EscS
MRLPNRKDAPAVTSHLSTLDMFFVAGPAVLVILASIIGLVVAIVQDIRESRIY